MASATTLNSRAESLLRRRGCFSAPAVTMLAMSSVREQGAGAVVREQLPQSALRTDNVRDELFVAGHR
jgi:hypothetical protein